MMIDTDLLFVFGLGLAVLMIPSIASAILDGRAPRTPALLIIVGGLMVGYAVLQKPTTYNFDTVDDAIVRVIGRYAN